MHGRAKAVGGDVRKDRRYLPPGQFDQEPGEQMAYAFRVEMPVSIPNQPWGT